MAKKKILIVTSSLVTGGLEKSLINLCDCLDYDKYEVDLYLFNEGRELLPQLNEHVKVLPSSPLYAEVYNYPLFKSLKILLKRRQFGLFFYRIRRFIRVRLKKSAFSVKDWKYMKKTMLKITDHYDVAMGFEEGSADYFVTECVDADIKNTWIQTDIKVVRTNWELDERAFKAATHICTVSRNSENSIAELHPSISDKIMVFNTPSLQDNSILFSMAKEPNEMDINTINIVSVGRLVELKGFHLCVKALYRLLQDGYNVKWYVAGDGSYRSEIEQEIERYKVKDNFILLGNKTNPYSYINSAKICVQMSSYEGYPLCVYEEKLLSKAVVVSDIASHKEMITDGKNGVVVPRDSDSIYVGVKRLLDDNDFLERVAKEPINAFITREQAVERIELSFSK